jgi:hypothetical protein
MTRMTISQHIQLAPSQVPLSHGLRARITELALATFLFALLSGAWLAFFMFFPFDFTPPRVG